MNAYQKFNQLAGQVTGEVISHLKQGKVLWRKPWNSFGLPQNYISGRHYEGFNAFYLNHITEKCGYRTPCYLTFRQALELGGRVRKGQKGTPILYWKVYEREQHAATGEMEAEEDMRQGSRLVPFLWTVFNIDQVEGVDFQLPPIPQRSKQQVIEVCQQVVDCFPYPRPQLLHGGCQAYYAPALDTVHVPEPTQFVSPEAYYATLFHELIHATGHASRLGRFAGKEKATRFGDEAYSKEELIAEMGACFLCANTGIQEQVFQNSVAYLQGWISRLRDDQTLLIHAATKAFKAASYILHLKTKAQQAAPLSKKAAA